MVTKCPGLVDMQLPTEELDSWANFAYKSCIITNKSEIIDLRRIVDEPETGNVDEPNFFFFSFPPKIYFRGKFRSKDFLIAFLERLLWIEQGLTFFEPGKPKENRKLPEIGKNLLNSALSPEKERKFAKIFRFSVYEVNQFYEIVIIFCLGEFMCVCCYKNLIN